MLMSSISKPECKLCPVLYFWHSEVHQKLICAKITFIEQERHQEQTGHIYKSQLTTIRHILSYLILSYYFHLLLLLCWAQNPVLPCTWKAYALPLSGISGPISTYFQTEIEVFLLLLIDTIKTEQF